MQIPPRVSALGGDYALLGGSTFSCDLTALAKNCEKTADKLHFSIVFQKGMKAILKCNLLYV